MGAAGPGAPSSPPQRRACSVVPQAATMVSGSGLRAKVVVVDARHHMLGRLASILAKELLNGQKVVRPHISFETDTSRNAHFQGLQDESNF